MKRKGQRANLNIGMKYIILLVVIISIIITRPWEISSADCVQHATDTVSLASSGEQSRLLPIGQVVRNEYSELSETQTFDRHIERFMKKWDIKGASFALMKDDRLLYAKGYGYADEENKIFTDVKHIFRIASISKLITATGIMKLQEEGKLRLEDKVFGPEGILCDTLFQPIKDKRITAITVEHLLRHQAGFSTRYGDPMFCSLDIARKMEVDAPASLNTIIRFVLSRSLHFTPGTSTAYSNIGYGILCRIIEKVSKQDYETYIQENILRPAGCFDMHLAYNYYEQKYPNEVRYYDGTDEYMVLACDGSGKLVPRPYGGNNMEALSGAGAWVASAAELMRFLAAINKSANIPNILSPASIKQMTTPTKNGLPLGWMHVTAKGEWIRSGTLSGTSALMKQQSNGYSWVFITNTGSWKGPKFQQYIDKTIRTALASVKNWPEQDLFEFQRFDQRQFLVEK